MRQAIYYAKNIAAGSNTVTVTFNQAAAYVDVRILEYSGLDPTNPLDVTAGAAGTSTSANSGAATTTSANELIFGAGMTASRFSCGGNRIHFPHHHHPGRGHCGRQGGEQHGQLQRRRPTDLFFQLGHADGDVPGQRARWRQPGADGEFDHANSGTANGGTAVTITGTGFLAGATVKLGGTAATGVTVVSSTSITATTPAHAAGAVSVVVTNTDAQSGTLTNGYTYTTARAAGARLRSCR